MKKYFLGAVLMLAFAGIAGAQTTEKTKTKNAVAKTSVKSPTTTTGIKTAGMQTGENKSTGVTTKEKTEPNKTKKKASTAGNATAIPKAPLDKHHKAKKKPKKKK